jgi:hypothetical protein
MLCVLRLAISHSPPQRGHYSHFAGHGKWLIFILTAMADPRKAPVDETTLAASDFVFRVDTVDPDLEFPFDEAKAAASKHGFDRFSIYYGISDLVGCFCFVLAMRRDDMADKDAFAANLVLLLGSGRIRSSDELVRFRHNILPY